MVAFCPSHTLPYIVLPAGKRVFHKGGVDDGCEDDPWHRIAALYRGRSGVPQNQSKAKEVIPLQNGRERDKMVA